MFDIAALIPWIVAAGGVLLAMFSGHGKKEEKKKRKAAEFVGKSQEVRAEIAEETTKEIIKSGKIANEKVQEARKNAADNVDRFTRDPFG